MGYFDQSDLPFYYFLANTFSIADRHFASVRSGTWPNRDFMLLGTADGVRRTGERCPDAALPTLFDVLDAHHVSWGVYSAGEPFEGALCWDSNHAGLHEVTAFFDALGAGALPQVVFVDGKENVEDEHPLADVQAGEAWTRRIYQAVIASSQWPSTAMVFTYDEAGGYFDHVAPGASCVGKPDDGDFFELGIRVPLIMISPWARPHHVSHVHHEHTSITRLIELVFDLPALTGRDASSDALLDMFDFEAQPTLALPAAPGSGVGGCNPQ
jgi:phospholipase C